ncbi:MAG: O-antigen ligase family protein, partial [Paludibacter sp.]
FGIAMAIGMILNIYRSVISKSNIEKVSSLFFMFIIGSALYFSVSRGPWLALMVGISVLFTLSPRQYLKILVVIGLLIIAVFIAKPGTYFSIVSLFSATLNPADLKGSSYYWRFTVLHVAIQNIWNASYINFLFGFGQGAHIINDFGTAALSTGRITEIESWDMELAIVLYEFGLIGIIAYLFFYFNMIMSSLIHLYSRVSDKNSNLLLITALASIATILFMKTNVSIFIPNIDYMEYISIAVVSRILSKQYMNIAEAS